MSYGDSRTCVIVGSSCLGMALYPVSAAPGRESIFHLWIPLHEHRVQKRRLRKSSHMMSFFVHVLFPPWQVKETNFVSTFFDFSVTSDIF